MNQDAHRGNHLCVTTSLYTEPDLDKTWTFQINPGQYQRQLVKYAHARQREIILDQASDKPKLVEISQAQHSSTAISSKTRAIARTVLDNS